MSPHVSEGSVKNTAGAAPVRRPGSLRRTSTIDVTWPDGRRGDLRLLGRARDVVTPRSGVGLVQLAEDSCEALLQPDRTIVSLRPDPPRPVLAALVGRRGGGRLRETIDELAPEERLNATPLYLLLDDISGASLVSSWAWSQWDPDWATAISSFFKDPKAAELLAQRRTVCIGQALLPAADQAEPNQERPLPEGTVAPDLRNPHDPEGWHSYGEQTGPGMRRARRMDIWRDQQIVIDAAFQDSSTHPEGGRRAVHEYQVTVTADPMTQVITSVVADPRVLPYAVCPGAVANVHRLVGAPLSDLRQKVLAALKGPAGCTHLNDALRALADAPRLLQKLDQFLDARD